MLHIYNVYSMKKHPQIDKTLPTCQATTFFPSANQGNARAPSAVLGMSLGKGEQKVRLIFGPVFFKWVESTN